jgi:hypothetical protein
MRRLALPVLAVALALAAVGASSAEVSKGLVCPNKASWLKLANRIKAPVYCPAWLPDPLVGTIGNRWNNINSVSPDRSYLESFVWQETGGGAAGGELHVNLRGYPGHTAIPICTETDTVGGKTRRPKVPCFADPRGTVRAPGVAATLYTVNQDADQWHLLLAWRHAGGLYTLSEHVAPPLDYTKVVAYLRQELNALVLIKPAA